MRIAVTGGRYYPNKGHVYRVLNALKPDEVAHGDCNCEPEEPDIGADFYVHEWCVELRDWVKESRYSAEWNKYGRAAGPMRNDRMLAVFKPDFLLVFRGGKGTSNCVSLAQKKGILLLHVPEPY